MQNEARNFQVLRIQKRQKTGWGAFLAHATRLHVPENIDPTKLSENMHFIGLNADMELKQVEYAPPQMQAKVRDRARKQVDERVGKLRSNAVYVTETIISASKEHLDTMSREEQIEYLKSGVQYLIDKFGADNFISAHFHFDEMTPHAHVFTSAVTQDSKTGKHKTHFKAFIDGPKELEQFQDNFHKQVGKQYGLGENLKKDRATHTELSSFYGLMEKHKTSIKTKNLVELGEMVENTHAKNAVERILSGLENVGEVISKITGKTPENLSQEELEVFNEVFTDKTIKPLRLRYENKVQKKQDHKEKLRREQEEFLQRKAHENKVIQEQVKPYRQIWLDSAEEYAEYVRFSLERSNYAPKCTFTNNLTATSPLVMFQKRLDDLQDALEEFYEDDSIGIRLKTNVAKFLATEGINYQDVSLNENLLIKFKDQKEQDTSFRLAFATNPKGVAELISQPLGAKALIEDLVKRVKDFMSEFRYNFQAINEERRMERYFENLRAREKAREEEERMRQQNAPSPSI